MRASTQIGLPTLNSDERSLVDHDTGLFARMLRLHALATAGRRVNPSIPRMSSLVAFLLEQPQEVARYMAPENPLVGEVPSWWSNPMWLSYADEAGLFEVDFNQGPLGHVSDKPTAVGTNLPDLRDLQGLKGETKGPWKGDSKQLATWAPGLVDAIALALRKWPQYKVYRVTPADWERHVAKNNHIPYRRDCTVCVHGAGGPAACRSGTPRCLLYVSRHSRANPHSWSRSRKQKPQTRHSPFRTASLG